MNELIFQDTIKRGQRGKTVKLVQEWLGLNGVQVQIDSDFGPATQAAVKEFQKKYQLGSTGNVDRPTFKRLTLPMHRALKPLSPSQQALGKLVVAYARQHLRQHPREIGGQNRGPWVRLYMNGHEGNDYPWCAGFVSFVLKQACNTLDVPLPIRPSFSCDFLATDAKQKGRFIGEKDASRKKKVKSGSIFLVRRTPTDWVHTGFVLNPGEETFQTIEGNTNDEGSREGYEVCKRVRGYGKKDFIVINNLPS